MKTRISHAIGLGLALCLLLCAVDAAAAPCSNQSLNGAYGFLSRTFGLPGLIKVGRLDSDGNGNFTETFTQNQGGVVTHETRSGTYSVNSDCSGFGSINSFEFVVLNGGNQVATVVPVLGGFLGGAELGSMQRISLQNSPNSCSNASLKGAFFSEEEGLSFGGIFGAAQGVASLFAFIADGAGNAAVKSLGPGAVPEVYSVNSDCTGSYTTAVPGTGSPESVDFVITADGSTLYGVRTDSANLALYIVAGKLPQ